MTVEAGTWPHEFCGFVGPARGCLDRDLSTEMILPPTQGDATVNVNESVHEVNFDETGNTPREVYSIGQRMEITYPMAYAHLEALAKAITGDNYVLSTTVAPAGTDGLGNALAARKTAKNSFQFCHKKTEYTFNIWRIAHPSFDSGGDEVARSEDYDMFGIYIPHCVIMAPNGEAFAFRNGSTVYTMRLLAVNPVGSADELYRVFNVDLAVA